MEVQTHRHNRHSHHHRRHKINSSNGASCSFKKMRIPHKRPRRRKNSNKSVNNTATTDQQTSSDDIKHGRPERGFIGRPTCNAPEHLTEYQTFNPGKESTSSNSEMEYRPEEFQDHHIEPTLSRDRGPQQSSRELRGTINTYESAILNLNYMIRLEKKCVTHVVEALELETKSEDVKEFIGSNEIMESSMEATSND